MKRHEINEDRVWLIEHPEYERRPADIRKFIVSPDYLGLANTCWLSIINELEQFYSGNYSEAAFCKGIGAGKSFEASIIESYDLHQLLCLRNPQQYFGLAEGSNICVVNMSVSAEHSRKIVFNELKSRVINSLWFMKYYQPDLNITTELKFPKNIFVFPGNSNENFPIGFNIYSAVLDEASFFIQTKDHDVAEEIFNALQSRMRSRFGDKSGKMVVISSPRYIEDFIERKLREAQENHKIFASRKKLWEVKPESHFSGKWVQFGEYQIPDELEDIAKRDPERFKRDYMALPSMVIEPFFKNHDLLEYAIDLQQEDPLDEQRRFKPWFKGMGYQYRIHVDLSLRRDSTGFAMAHNEDDWIVVDLMEQIKVPINGEINIAGIRERIVELQKRGFDIAGVTFDGWQSADSIQFLNSIGIQATVLSVDKDTAAYDTLKERIYSKKIKYYRYQPFLDELKRLEFIEGKKIDHPRSGSKDVADAVAGAVFMCVSYPNNFSFTGSEEIKAKWKVLRAQGIDPVSVMGRGAPANTDKLVHYGECNGRYFPPSPIGWI
ncbi:MAG: hypothetical protein WCK61_03295 [Candidatus Omnitrophota bacterium]